VTGTTASVVWQYGEYGNAAAGVHRVARVVPSKRR
jgi:hypothetical protein